MTTPCLCRQVNTEACDEGFAGMFLYRTGVMWRCRPCNWLTGFEVVSTMLDTVCACCCRAFEVWIGFKHLPGVAHHTAFFVKDERK